MAATSPYNPGMPHDPASLEERARELARKLELLASLEEKLAAWQTQLGPQDLPDGKRRALNALARESIATLQSMIERVSGEIPVEPQRYHSLDALDKRSA